MSEEYLAPSNTGGGTKSIPDNPRTILMVLSKKPTILTGDDGKAKGVKLGFSPNRTEREENGGKMGRYDLIGQYVDEVAVFDGQLMTPVAGKVPGFADAESIPPEAKGKGVILNGEMLYPTGEDVQVLMVVDKNAQKLASFKVGGIAILEDVSLRAPALPNKKGVNLQGALVPVPNGVKGAQLVACTDRTRGAYFHIGPNAKTAGDRLSYLGYTMVMPTPWEAKKRETDAPNAAPIMMGGINGAMGVVVDVANSYTAEGTAGVAEFAGNWQQHLKAKNSTAYAGAIVQLFRKPIDAKTGEMLDDTQAQAMFDKMRANGLEPQQAFVFTANDFKDAAGKWQPRTTTEALETFLTTQERNVGLMHARIEDGTNNSSIKAQNLRSLMDGGLWSIVVLPVEAWNVGKSIKDNVGAGRFNPMDNWLSQNVMPGQRKVSERGNVVSYDPLMACAYVYPGKVGSFKPAEGEAPKDTVFAGMSGIRQGYLEVLQVDGGHVMVDARPMDKNGEVPVPPRLLITPYTPTEHIVDMQRQANQLVVNARATQFSSARKPKQEQAPKEDVAPQPDAVPPADDTPSGPRI